MLSEQEVRALVAVGLAAGCEPGGGHLYDVTRRSAAAIRRSGGCVHWRRRSARWRPCTVIYGRPLPALVLWGGLLLHPRDPAHAAHAALKAAGVDPDALRLRRRAVRLTVARALALG